MALLGGRNETGSKIGSALEAAGVEFIDENGDGPGVRLRKRSIAQARQVGLFRELKDDALIIVTVEGSMSDIQDNSVV